MKRIIAGLLTLMLLVNMGSGVAFADSATTSACPNGMSAQDCQSIYGNWTRWVPDGSTGSCDSSSTATLTGNDNTERAYNFFISSAGGSLTPVQAAAVVGNLVDESHLDPTIMQKGGNSKNPADADTGAPGHPDWTGWGIAQWSPGSKIIGIASDLGISEPIYELGTQLQIVYKEMTGTSPVGASNMMAGLTKISDLAEAVEYFRTQYEGGIPGTRLEDAKDVLRLYGNTATDDSGDTDTSTASSEPTTTDSCSSGSISGSGSGNFNTVNPASAYPGLQTMLNNAAAAAEPNDNKTTSKTISNEAVCGSSSCTNTCMHTMAALWGYSNSGYSSPYLSSGVQSMWDALDGTKYKHPGSRDVPVGALLIYSGDPGHVVIYLGNNLIVGTDTGADGSYVSGGGIHIVSADSIEKKWGMNYLGWADPVFFGQLGYGSVHY